MTRLNIAMLPVLFVAAAGYAGEPREYTVPLFEKPPTVDGRFSPAEWDRAAGFDGMQFRGVLAERSVRAYVGATADALYAAVVSELPPNGTLLGRVDSRSRKIVYDDAVEVLLAPEPAAGTGRVYRVMAGAGGATAFFVTPGDTGGCPSPWDAPCSVAGGLTADRWVVEIRIPVAAMAPGRAATDGAWGIAVCRDWKRPWRLSSIAPGGYDPRTAIFRFSDEAVVAQFEHRGDPYRRAFDCRLRVKNLTGAPVSATAAITLGRNTMPAMKTRREWTLRPGEEKTLVFTHTETNADGFELRAVAAAGDRTIYAREYRWGRPRKERWTGGDAAIVPLDFAFSYYPYRRRIRVLADSAGLKPDARLASLTFTVRKQGGGPPVATEIIERFPAARVERIFAVPRLDGAYEIAMTAAGEGVPAAPLVKTFVRKHWPWERAGLGGGNTVYPPFTPITLEGMTVGMVLKEYALNRCGLVDRVTAGGRQILAAPMRFVATVDGAEQSIEVRSFRIVEKADHVLRTESRFAAGPLAVTVAGRWDYDGMLTGDLFLEPTGGARVDELRLAIPLKDEHAPLIHAMTEGIRKPCISRRLPDGTGVIWTADELAHFDMPQGFCTYIFLGGPLRGLSWFADNDRGWSWDRDTPNLTVARRDGVLTLTVNLVNEPVVVEQRRRLRFGILAAPVKPRLPGWRHRWWTDRCTLLGTNINWLSAPGHASEVYPPGKDLFFWEMLARANTEQLPKETIRAVERKGLPWFAPWGEAEAERWVRHVRHNLRARRDKTMIFYYNRAVNNTNPEYATFMNEWVLNDYPPRDAAPSLGEIKYVPSASLIDFSLHWYAKSFAYRNRGVYWDNWFIKPSFNRVMTDAYRDDDGTVVPAAGIWDLRELARRTFVMMNRKDMLPITMPHMTSTNILPMHSFATVQYDWEWKYSAGDVQDRFSREYLLLVSNGGLAGTWPVLLGDHGTLAGDEWTQRTFAGVSLVHELLGDGRGKVWKTLRDPLIAMMKDPQLRVYRYWDEAPQPLAADNPDLPVIVYALPGRIARAVLCSYADADVTARIRIDPAALGFTGPYTVADYETGTPFAVENDTLTVPVKKHQVIGFAVRPGGGT